MLFVCFGAICTQCFQKCNLFQALETSASAETARQNETIVVQPAVDNLPLILGTLHTPVLDSLQKSKCNIFIFYAFQRITVIFL